MSLGAQRPRSRGAVLASAVVASLFMAMDGGVAVAQSPAVPAASPAPLEVLDFKPGLDDLMTMLVQPRHLKLFFAGSAQNWELAAFQVKELRSAFRRTGQTIPRYRKMGMDATVASMMSPPLKELDAAIAAKDAKRFAAAYGRLTDACNACHQVMEHGFLIVKVPTAAADSIYPNQDFKIPQQ